MNSIDPRSFDAIVRGEAVAWTAVGMMPGAFLDACAALEVSEIVHFHLAHTNAGSDWPPAVCSALAERTHASAARELLSAQETARVLERLSAHGVRPILLKGTPLAHTVYPHAALRHRTDTDLLVRREEVATVRDTFVECGYRAPVMSDGELVFRQFQMMRFDEIGVQHVFDVHWGISTQALFADVLTYDELDRSAVPVASLGPRARCASPVHALLLACIHPVMHHRNSDRTIWVYDVHLLARALPERQMTAFAQLAVDKEVGHVCADRLSLAAARFHTPVAANVLTALRVAPTEPTRIYLRPSRRWHHELLSNLRGLRRAGDRMTLIREILIPHPRYMLARYGLGSGGFVLLPVLYAHRACLGVLKIVSGRK